MCREPVVSAFYGGIKLLLNDARKVLLSTPPFQLLYSAFDRLSFRLYPPCPLDNHSGPLPFIRKPLGYVNYLLSNCILDVPSIFSHIRRSTGRQRWEGSTGMRITRTECGFEGIRDTDQTSTNGRV